MKKQIKKIQRLVLFSLMLMLCCAAGFAQTAYIPNSFGSVSVINVATDSVTGSIPFVGTPCAIAVSPDGRKVYISDNHNYKVSVANTATNTISNTILTGDYPYALTISPDGSKLYVGCGFGNTFGIAVVNTATDSMVGQLLGGWNAYGFDISPDGSKIYALNNDKVYVCNTTLNTVITTIAVGAGAYGVKVSPDGNKVYVTNPSTGKVSIINSATNTVSATVTVDIGIRGLCFSPNGEKVYITNPVSNNVGIINTTTNAVVKRIPCGGSVNSISISPNGSKVYACADNVNACKVEVINTVTDTISNEIFSSPQNNFGQAFQGNFISIYPATIAPASALHFDGINDYIVLPNSLSINAQYNNKITVEGWFYLAAVPAAGTKPALITEGYLGDDNVQFTMYLDGSQTIKAGFYNGSWVEATSTTSLPLNTWTHIAATYDQANIKIYINGVEDASFAATLALPNGTEQWYMGKRWDNTQFFAGKMDEIRIWNVARSAARISVDKDCEIPSSSSGLVANYHFNHGLANTSNPLITTLVDSSGNGYNGTLTNCGLTGNVSNWVAPGAVTTGTACAISTDITAAANEAGMLVYPNPATSKLTVALLLANVGNVSVTLCDITGQVVKQAGMSDYNNGQIDFNVANLTSGLYFVTVQGTGWERNAKIVIGQ